MSVNKPEIPVSAWKRTTAALRRFWNWLTAPGPEVVEVGDRRLAQILAILALLFALLNGVGVISSAAINQTIGTSANITLLVLAVVALIAYFLSRGRYFRVGCWLLVWSLALSGFLLLPTSDNPASAIYSTVVLAYAMGTVLLPVWGLVALVVVTVTAMFAMPAVLPAQVSATVAGTVGGNIMTVGIMLAILSAFRESVEKSRIREAQAATDQLRILSASLEQQVASRTRELSLAGQVGRSLAQERDLDRLLAFAVEQIQAAYKLYYTQIYLVDPGSRALVLRAGSGEVGAELLRRAHRLEVGLGSVNGRAALERRPVLVSDTAASRTFRPNPLLPGTRSEAAVPLIVGTQLVGVLDMQSEAPGSFSEVNLPAFETLAGQLAVAVDNAALLSQLTQAQKDVEAAAGVQVQRSWSDYLDAIERGEVLGYALQLEGGAMQVSPWSASDENGSQPEQNLLAVPLEVSGVEVGAISFERAEGEWSQEERELVQSIAGRVAHQLDALRLLEQSEDYRNQAEAATRRLQRQGWDEFLAQRAAGGLAYAYDRVSVTPLSQAELMAAGTENSTLEPYTWPLAAGGEALGEISLEGLDGLDAAAVEMIETVAERLAEHIDSLRLFEQSQFALSETETLYNIIAEMNQAQNYREILAALSSRTLLARADSLLLMAVFDRPKNGSHTPEWILPVAWQSAAEVQIAQRYPLNAFEPTPNTLFTTEAAVMPDLAREPRLDRITRTLFQNVFRAQSSVILPLLVGGQAIGFVQGYFSQPTDVSNEDVERLMVVVSQAAIAVQSRLLLEQAQARARQEQRIRQVSAEVSSAADVDTILKRAVEQVGRTLGTSAFIYVGKPSSEKTA